MIYFIVVGVIVLLYIAFAELKGKLDDILDMLVEIHKSIAPHDYDKDYQDIKDDQAVSEYKSKPDKTENKVKK